MSINLAGERAKQRALEIADPCNDDICGANSDDADFRLVFSFAAASVVATFELFLSFSVQTAFAHSSIGFGGTYVLLGAIATSRKRSQLEELEYFVPVVMERLVMAVESGLDLIPALKEISDERNRKTDRVSEALGRVVELSENGENFEQAVNLVAESISNESFKHLASYLCVAHREGGSLIEPLRELADASQNTYQDAVEERIAKLPVNATFPLVLCFAGIVCLLLAPPIAHLMDFMSKAAIK